MPSRYQIINYPVQGWMWDSIQRDMLCVSAYDKKEVKGDT